ncbi:Fic family protein [Loktanella sp. D2R18]|uniref:Fic family protein n=1 Tax=Rhodobacterales TaxID=204455 RepID=UPI000DEA3836|nr:MULTISPECIES: DUF4172 domain-containing protein [Rhodobacterales]MDO6591931.1 DUF4172 domain-containing protein [Yoonia sp. 1_MG-2023]RBW45662.1 Fic family protein [Loktanella sp. D2R18]
MVQIWQSGHWPNFVYDHAAVEPYLAQAMHTLGEVQGVHAGIGPDDLAELHRMQIVQEALASFEIEGVSLNQDEIEASVIASIKHREGAAISRRTDAIVSLMVAARNMNAPVTEQHLCDWHRLLFYGIEVENLGMWRGFDIEIVRSATAGSHDVLYKAPPPDLVPGHMRDFVVWLRDEATLPVPIRAAIAHLWFESIHPFSDGNGRIGRALIEAVFAASRPLPFSFSRQIEKEKLCYYAALQAGRQEGRGGIDATPFVIWFLQSLTRAADAGREEAMYLVRRNHFFARHRAALNPRQHKALTVIFEQGAERVALGLSAKSYRKIAKTTAPTATRDLVALESAGVLRRSAAGGRSTRYVILY